MPLYLNGGDYFYLDEDTGLLVTLSLDYNTKDQNNRVHKFFNPIELSRINLKNSLPPSLKSTNIVWILRGTRQSDGATISWRSPNTPSVSFSGTQIVTGTEKVIGYFYDDT
jgi:hypothetical protein